MTQSQTYPSQLLLLILTTLLASCGTDGPLPPATTQCEGDQVSSVYYRDADHDGFGNEDEKISACIAPNGYSHKEGDCDDKNPTIRPDIAEICDSIDNNCNGQIDENLATTVYADNDGDGFGNPLQPIESCFAIGFVADASDCDDNSLLVNTARLEVCDGLDNNCNGDVDEGAMVTLYRDSDGDGFGSPQGPIEHCGELAGYTPNNADCDDSRAFINPLGTETCNGLDDDCDGQIDGNTRTCSNECGVGIEVCRKNRFTACSAPRVTNLPTETTLAGNTTHHFECLIIEEKLSVGKNAKVISSSKIMIRGENAELELEMGAELHSEGPIVIEQQARIESVLASISSNTLISIASGAEVAARGLFDDSIARTVYSGGGGAPCSDVFQSSKMSGATGGARGGHGGQGPVCGGAASPRQLGISSAGSINGMDSCAVCPCEKVVSSNSSGGFGGGPLCGGGGGGNGARGGSGQSGLLDGIAYAPGDGGKTEGKPAEMPTFGGAGGGAGGGIHTQYSDRSICGSTGGYGGGILSLVAPSIFNAGLISADGGSATSINNQFNVFAGAGGGSGGSIIIMTTDFRNLGLVSATGGNGSRGSPFLAGAFSCDSTVLPNSGGYPGGGGGGGGGKIFVTGWQSLPLTAVERGTLQVNGGKGGLGGCGQTTTGVSGGDGWVQVGLATM